MKILLFGFVNFGFYFVILHPQSESAEIATKKRVK